MRTTWLQGMGLLTGLVGLAQLGACASTSEPTDRLVSAESAIRAANEVGVSSNPNGQLHAKLAQEELAQAKRLIRDGENERAERLLWRATADAELAIAVTREDQSKRAAMAAEGTVTE